MPLSCVDASVGARIVAVLGLVTSGVVVAQLGAELARGAGDGGVAVLLGLSLDELDSRQRHTLHSDKHDHDHDQLLQALADPGDRPPHPFDTYVRDILVAFLVYAVLYLFSSGLLAYSSLVALRWGALPWLLLQAMSVASQVARLVVQVAQRAHEAEHQLHAGYAHPMAPHPIHPGHEALDEHIREHVREHEVRREHSAVIGIVVTTAYLAVSAYMWLVVLVAHRDWSSSSKLRRGGRGGARGVGDEGYSLSMTNIPAITKETLGAVEEPSEA
ncbi:Putative KilA-N domain-containing protein R878 [Frankliniella fusca]|uniref:KilA-N domain-containing protein R878 n=1 Tax=Frankliniella fusca TaxID=407009 RepID=A0AAE1GZB6_9NEOP|nr:Putative KilA-N domain-containing protein R878 [Frankliniella fusca]